MPNENISIFLIGLVIGALACGITVYKVEELRYVSLQNSYQVAVTKAQDNVIHTVISSEKINQTLGDDDAKKINNVIAGWRASRVGLQPSASGSLPSVSASSGVPAKTTCDGKRLADLQTVIALEKIQINELQKWIIQQAAIYHQN